MDFGAAGGDEGVGVRGRGVDLGGEGAGEAVFERGGGGGLVPGVHGGVEGGGGEVGGDGDGEGRAVEVGCAEGVGGVGGAVGEGVDEGAQGVVGAGAVVGEYVAARRRVRVRRRRAGPPAGRGPRAVGCAVAQGVEDGVEEGPQGVRGRGCRRRGGACGGVGWHGVGPPSGAARGQAGAPSLYASPRDGVARRQP